MMQKNTFGEILFSLCNSEKMMVQKTRWSKKLYEQMFFDTVLIRNVTESFMGMQVKLNLTKSSRIDYSSSTILCAIVRISSSSIASISFACMKCEKQYDFPNRT